MFLVTIDRQSPHGPQRLSDGVSDLTRDNVARFASASSERLDERLRQLTSEWDVERILALTAGIGLGIGIVLSVLHSLWWLLFAAAIATSLLMQSAFAWSPVLPVVRWMGFRTGCEIARERYALKALRGDFQKLDLVTTPRDREDLCRFEDEGGPPAPESWADASDPEIINEALRAVAG